MAHEHHNHSHEANESNLKRVMVALVLTGFFMIVEVVGGIISGSLALLADAGHMLTDTMALALAAMAFHVSKRPPDGKLTFGYQRFQILAAFVNGLSLLAIVGWILFEAVMRFINPHEILGETMLVVAAAGLIVNLISFGVLNTGDQENLNIRGAALHVAGDLLGSVAAIVAALVSVVLKEGLYWYTVRVGRRIKSLALIANAWHHRSDALSSVAVAVGFIAMKFGFEHGDHIAAIVVGLMIILVGAKVFGGCLHEFAERSVDTDTIAQIEDIIASESRIRHWHKLRTRSAGREVFLDLHILVDPALNITEAHEIAESLEDSMHAQITRPVNITIHIEPDNPELRYT
jgi:Co/Zn/Cd efflux system component